MLVLKIEGKVVELNTHQTEGGLLYKAQDLLKGVLDYDIAKCKTRIKDWKRSEQVRGGKISTLNLKGKYSGTYLTQDQVYRLAEYVSTGFRKAVFGAGINDANYTVYPIVNGKQVMCPFYRAWRDMLKRCYDTKYQAKNPTYLGCLVCREWLTFSNFKSWMENQDWQGKQLDKDLLAEGNKVYSPETCVFVEQRTNKFILCRSSARGVWPVGVTLFELDGKFQALCANPFTGKRGYIGLFDCPNVAHKAWQAKKHEYAYLLAEQQPDPRVAKALRERYAPDKDWTKV